MATASTIFFIRTPLGEKGGLAYGGPLRMRAGRLRAYAGFASRELAERVCVHWSMTRNVRIEPWYDAIEHDAPDARPEHILFFDVWCTFESYLKNPDEFPYARNLIQLHPVLNTNKRLNTEGEKHE